MFCSSFEAVPSSSKQSRFLLPEPSQPHNSREKISLDLPYQASHSSFHKNTRISRSTPNPERRRKFHLIIIVPLLCCIKELQKLSNSHRNIVDHKQHQQQHASRTHHPIKKMMSPRPCSRSATTSTLSLPRVRLVHSRNFTGNRRPFEFAAERFAAILALEFFPFEEFVANGECQFSKMKGAKAVRTYEKRR